MSDLLLSRVRVFLQSRRLLDPHALLIAAVSGGPDSLCLLHLLSRLRAEGGPRLLVAHLDHGFRGAESAAEAAFVADVAARWGLDAQAERRDVPALARLWGEGAQAAARRARYGFLADLARARGAQAVAVAHNADDQAETVLLHALRGAGPAGLRGMRAAVPWAEWAGQKAASGGQGRQAPGEPSAPVPPPSAPLIRPLLATTRAEILTYCAEQGLEPRDDPSNRARRYARSRVRHDLMPALARQNPRVVEALGRSAAICADDYDFIQGQLDQLWPALAEEAPGVLRLRAAVWGGLHPALQRYALRRAAAQLGAAEPSYARIEAARALAPGGRAALGGGLQLVGEAAALVLRRGDPPPAPAELPQLPAAELPLAWPGVTPIGAGWRCVVARAAPAAPSPWWVALDPAALDGPALLRRRRPGDRFRPAGGRGSRKLQDFFTDRKLPRALRDAWPILATPGAIVWVAGLRADGRFVARGPDQDTIWVGLLKGEE